MSYGSLVRLINRGKKHKCIVSGIYLFEDEMVRLQSGKWAGKRYFGASIRPDNPGLTSRRKGSGWFRPN